MNDTAAKTSSATPAPPTRRAHSGWSSRMNDGAVSTAVFQRFSPRLPSLRSVIARDDMLACPSSLVRRRLIRRDQIKEMLFHCAPARVNLADAPAVARYPLRDRLAQVLAALRAYLARRHAAF